jgi:Filamin/ABP280 repeat
LISISDQTLAVNILVDARDAGDGTLEINITGPSGRSVANTVTQLGPGRFEVVFVPSECGQYLAAVTFNKENVPGIKRSTGMNIYRLLAICLLLNDVAVCQYLAVGMITSVPDKIV